MLDPTQTLSSASWVYLESSSSLCFDIVGLAPGRADSVVSTGFHIDPVYLKCNIILLNTSKVSSYLLCTN